MSKPSAKEGVCKLTGQHGKFVDAHIIPEALSHRERDIAMIQSGYGRPKRRWTSWYDPQLVTEAGEKILSSYDDWAIKELRRSSLVWSGWGPMQALSTPDHTRLPDMPWGMRKVEGIDGKRLRLFLLSVLWRAAETTLWEFEPITATASELSTLRQMVLTGNTDPGDFFPITLIQLSTLGRSHNHSPTEDVKTIPAIEGLPETMIPIFRFYFDGLIVHFDRRQHADDFYGSAGPHAIGSGETLHVATVTYEASFQRDFLIDNITNTARLWPEIVFRGLA